MKNWSEVLVFCIRDFQSIIFSKNLHGLIFHKHIVLSVKLRKSERMNVSHKIPTARMQVYSDSDKKYFYMHDLTDKFVCAHCMHACRIPTGPTADLQPTYGRSTADLAQKD